MCSTQILQLSENDAIIGYIKRIQDNLRHVCAIYADKTDVADYIVEDMENRILQNVTDVNFTDQSKESLATCLKEQMRSSVCPGCGWEGYVDSHEGEWRTSALRDAAARKATR